MALLPRRATASLRPHCIDLSPQGTTASTVLANGYGWCVPKAALLTAVCRAAGIPRMGFADVQPPQHRAHARTMVTFIWHGYRHLARWRTAQATPAFNIGSYERWTAALEFDGENDSIYHPFDKSGARHMEYDTSARRV